MSRATLRLPTPLGDLEFSAEAHIEPTLTLSLNSVEFEPSLPDGMSIAACYAVVLHINTPREAVEIQFKAQLHSTIPLKHGAETGEGLDAQAWYNKQFVLLVGTEDAEALTARLQQRITFNSDEYPFTYSENFLSVQVTCLPSANPLSLHFVAAWNELPEPQDCSCWFAVDQRHIDIAAALATQIQLKKN